MRPLLERLQDVPQIGRVTWIGVRVEHGGLVHELREVVAIAGRGLRGDVSARARPGGKRQVTLFQQEHLPVLASFLDVPEVGPEKLRRNLLIAGINLVALTKLRFAVGEVVLVGTGACAPCAKLDELLGQGGFQATRGHGGITARIELGGTIRIGDPVRVLEPTPSERSTGLPEA